MQAAWGLAAWGLLAMPAVGHAQLEAADAAFEEGRLVEAARAYEDALSTGRLDRAQVAQAHLRLGALSALGSEDARAALHFRIALSLDPGAEAPRELEAEARERFEQLRGERLRVAVGEEEGRAATTIEVRGAPEGAARTVEVLGVGDFLRRFAWEGESIALDVPAEARPVEVRVLDAHGNVLARHPPVRSEVQAPTAAAADDVASAASLPAADLAPSGAGDGEADAAAGPPPSPAEAEESLIESPWFWVVVGVLVVGVSVAVGFAASGERFVLDAPVVR